jgi:hypothetical protein
LIERSGKRKRISSKNLPVTLPELIMTKSPKTEESEETVTVANFLINVIFVLIGA